MDLHLKGRLAPVTASAADIGARRCPRDHQRPFAEISRRRAAGIDVQGFAGI